jgi:predicted site-specific integrase-resolvase
MRNHFEHQFADTREYLGVHHNTIYNWDARGELLVHRNPANRYRFSKHSDLEKILKKDSTIGKEEEMNQANRIS